MSLRLTAVTDEVTCPLASGRTGFYCPSMSGSDPGYVYHLALPVEWEEADCGDGSYRRSTRGLDLREVGFIHCSYAHQVGVIANARYGDSDEVVLVVIDPVPLTSPLVSEPGDPGGEDFPHIYGPLNRDAVVSSIRWLREPPGFMTPELVRGSA